MTTITREHLELAAKAAGYAVHRGSTSGAAIRTVDGIAALWRPHTDPADAWQLAADCAMEVNFDVEHVKVRTRGSDYVCQHFGEDTNRTATEAVTLAAAEIGRAMG